MVTKVGGLFNSQTRKIQALNHESPLVRRKAITLLLKKAWYPKVKERLIKMCREDKDPMVRVNAIVALAKSGAERSELKNLFKDASRQEKDWAVRWILNQSLMQLKKFEGG